MKKRNIFFIVSLGLFLTVFTAFMVLVRADFHGDSFSGVDVILGNSTQVFDQYFPNYSRDNTLIYRSHNLERFDLPLILKWNGTTGQPTRVLTVGDVTESLNKLHASDDIHITGVSFLVNQTYTVPNVTVANVVCSPTSPPNCTKNMTNGTTTLWRWTWVPLDPVLISKDKYYAVDITGIRNPSALTNAVDVTATILNFKIDEFAWWNSSFTTCRNINLNQAYYNYTIGMNLTFTGAKSDWGDLRFVDKACNNNGNIMPYWFEQNTSSWVQVWVGTGAQSLSAFSVYYGDSNSNYIGNGFQTFPLFDDFNGGTLNTSIWTQDSGSSTVAGGYIKLGTGANRVNGNGVYGNSFAIVSSANITSSATYTWAGTTFDDSILATTQRIQLGMNGVGGQAAIRIYSAPTDSPTNFGAVNDFTGTAFHRWEIIRNSSNTDNTANVDWAFKVRDNTHSVLTTNMYNTIVDNDANGNAVLFVDYVFGRNYTFPDATVTVASAQSVPIAPSMDNGTLNTTYQNTTLISNNNTAYNNLGNVSFSQNITNNNGGQTLDTITFMFGGNITTKNFTNRYSVDGIRIFNNSVQGIFYINMTFPNLTTGRFWYLWSANVSSGDYNQTVNSSLVIYLAVVPPAPPPPPAVPPTPSFQVCDSDNSTLILFSNKTFLSASQTYWNATNETRRCPYGCDAVLNDCDPPPFLIYLYIAVLTFITIIFAYIIKRLANR